MEYLKLLSITQTSHLSQSLRNIALQSLSIDYAENLKHNYVKKCNLKVSHASGVQVSMVAQPADTVAGSL